jgi:tetratricopeptide (TPR) repeat protein
MRHSPAVGARNAFVGREPELAALLSGLEDARAGRGRFIALVGEAGVGKTRTLEEFVARAGLPEERILWGRCPEHHGLPAYWPWTQAIGRYLERCDPEGLPRVLGRGAADLAQIIPSIGERLGGLEPPAAFDAAQARLRLFDSMAALLRRTAESEPIVLVLDDLHWADEGSVQLLAFLAPELRRCQTLLLASYREREMKRSPRLLAEVARVGERIPMRGLRLDEAERFIRDRVEGDPRQALVAHLHRVSQGNPFFLDELVRMLRKEGRLDGDDVTFGGALPDEVREVIRRNLEPLSAEDRDLLTTAAVIGYDFDVARLRAVAGLPPDRLLERLESAAAAGVVEELPGASGQFRFAHMLIRDAFYGELSPLDRARRHRDVGTALEELYRGARDLPCAELARHFVHAAVLGDAGKALEYASRAGQQALGRLAYEESAGHFEVALKILRLDRPDEARELELRLALGQAQTFRGDHPHARTTFERAAERARALGDAASFARAALGYSFAAPGVGAVYTTLVALLEDALRLLDEEDGPLRAAVLGSLASSLYFSRDEGRREDLSREAVAMARRVGQADALARALVQRHHVLWGPAGAIADRLALCDEMTELADEHGDRQLALHAQLWRLVDLLEKGDLAALDAALERFAREADHARIPLYRWFAGVVRATRAEIDGRLAESERLAEEALALWQEDPLSLSAQTLALQRLLVRLEIGELAPLAETFLEMARAYPALPGWRSGVALLHAESGRADEARAVLDEFAARDFADLPRDFTFLSSLASFALVAHSLRDVDHATVLYERLLPFAERYVSVGFAAGSFGAAARYLGLLAATTGRLDDAVRHLEAALAVNRALGSRPLVAQTQCDLAQVLLARHERARAETLLEEARETAKQLGLARLLARCGAPGGVAEASARRTVDAVFHRDGTHWTIRFDGRTVRMKHAKGSEYLAVLLRSPGREVHVLDLAAGGPVESPVAGAPEAVRVDSAGDAGDVIDPQARTAYRRRLAELAGELEEARSFHDTVRAERLQDEIDTITQELSRALGLGGRHRKAGSAAERARVNVSRAIAAVLKKISEEHPALGEHLAARVHTGTFCSYDPDPLVTVEWRF